MCKLKKIILPFLVISILGTLSHFIYEWSGNQKILGYIFPVNESVWEHLKLIFYPSLIYFFVEYLLLKEKPKSYISASIISIFHGMFLIIVLYYLTTGIIGKNIDFLNIFYYYLSVAYMLIKRENLLKSYNLEIAFIRNILIIILVLMILLFARFSYLPLDLRIFNPPI